MLSLPSFIKEFEVDKLTPPLVKIILKCLPVDVKLTPEEICELLALFKGKTVGELADDGRLLELISSFVGQYDQTSKKNEPLGVSLEQVGGSLGQCPSCRAIRELREFVPKLFERS